MILRFFVMLKLENDIDMIDLLDIHALDISVCIYGVYRNRRIVHLLCETGQMETHDLVDSPHRIVVILRKRHIVYGHMLSIQQNLFLEDA